MLLQSEESSHDTYVNHSEQWCVYTTVDTLWINHYAHKMKSLSLSSSCTCSPAPAVIWSAKVIIAAPGTLSMIPHLPRVLTRPTMAFKLLTSMIIITLQSLKYMFSFDATFPSVSHSLTSARITDFPPSAPKNGPGGTARMIIFSRSPYQVQVKTEPLCILNSVSNYMFLWLATIN